MSGGWHHRTFRTSGSGYPGGGSNRLGPSGTLAQQQEPHWIVGCAGEELLVAPTVVPVINIDQVVRDFFHWNSEYLRHPMDTHRDAASLVMLLAKTACSFDNRNMFLVIDQKKIAASPRASAKTSEDCAGMVVERLMDLGIIRPGTKPSSVWLATPELDSWIASARLFLEP